MQQKLEIHLEDICSPDLSNLPGGWISCMFVYGVNVQNQVECRMLNANF